MLLCVAWRGRAAGEAPFQTGIEAGRVGNFADAASAFKDSLRERPAVGTLFNLGIVEWRRGRVGEAVAAWEQATWLDPFDQDARNNLEFARQAAQLEPPEMTWFETSSIWLPANFWAGIACASLWLAVGMWVLPKVLRIRKAWWHQSLAAFGLCVFLLSLPPNFGVITRAKLGVVLGKRAVLRLTPTREGEVISSLATGESVRQLRARGNFYYVRTARGAGWIERSQVQWPGQPLK